MLNIVTGTTPTIKYSFSMVNPTDIRTAILSFKKHGEIVLEKDLSSAVIDEDTIAWTLSQTDTLSVGTGDVEVMLNWLDVNGIRGVGKKDKVNFTRNHINEVLTNE